MKSPLFSGIFLKFIIKLLIFLGGDMDIEVFMGVLQGVFGDIHPFFFVFV